MTRKSREDEGREGHLRMGPECENICYVHVSAYQRHRSPTPTPRVKGLGDQEQSKVNPLWSCQSISCPPTPLLASWAMSEVAVETEMKVRHGPDRISSHRCAGLPAAR